MVKAWYSTVQKVSITNNFIHVCSATVNENEHMVVHEIYCWGNILKLQNPVTHDQQDQWTFKKKSIQENAGFAGLESQSPLA